MKTCSEIDYASTKVELEIDNLINYKRRLHEPASITLLIILLLCLFYVYGLNYKLKKPVFIHALWALTSMSILFAGLKLVD